MPPVWWVKAPDQKHTGSLIGMMRWSTRKTIRVNPEKMLSHDDSHDVFVTLKLQAVNRQTLTNAADFRAILFEDGPNADMTDRSVR